MDRGHPLMLTSLSLEEPSTIDDFDDSDVDAFQDSNDSSHHPLAVESRIPNHLLLVSLLESLVASYEKDPTRRKKMFHIICKHLDDMNVIPSWEFIENFSTIRAQYSSIVHSMMMAVTNMMDKQAQSNFLSLPSTANERTFALLGNSDPLSPRTPTIRTEEVLRNQSSRYKTEFNEIQKIGKGGFGSVFKVKNKLDQKEYAVKKIKLKQKHPESARKVLREVQLLASLDHPNIVGYNAAWIEAEPVHVHKTKAWALPLDKSYERKSQGRRIQFSRSNSHNGNYFSEPVLQSPPSTASTITATPRSPSNVHQFERPPLTPESLSKTPQAVPRTTERSFDQPRSWIVETTFMEVNKTESLKINGTEIVETSSRNHSNSSEMSKSGDSLDDILCIHGVHQQGKRVSRTNCEYDSSFKSKSDFEELEIHRTAISSSYSKYETEEDLSIRFEESTHLDSGAENYTSQVQYEKVDYNYLSKRQTMEQTFHLESASEVVNVSKRDDGAMAVVPHKPMLFPGILSGQFGHTSLLKKSGKPRMYMDSDDSSSKPLDSDIDGKLNLAGRRHQYGRKAVSFNPTSEVSRNEGGLLAKSNLFAGLSVVLYIQMQLCSRTLSGWLKERNEIALSLPDSFDAVNMPHNMQIFEGILKGVQYIHSNGFMHRDLKPKNIFIEGNNLQVRIGDFGLARHDVVERSKSVGDDFPLTPFDTINKWDFLTSSTMHTSGVGTATYASPEQLNGSRYDSKSDMYSAGIIMFELFHPFSTAMERAKCIHDLRQGHVASEIKKRWSKQSAIIENLVAADSKDRPTADEVLQSELFVSKDEMINSLKSQLAEMSKLLKQKQIEDAERNAELRDARLKLKEKDALIIELLNNRSASPR